MIKIDTRSFEQTAQAVHFTNPSAQERFDNWNDLYDFMMGFAYQYGHDEKTHSFSTGGFQLTFFDRCDGSRGVMASVSAYTVLSYIKEREERKIKLAEEILKC